MSQSLKDVAFLFGVNDWLVGSTLQKLPPGAEAHRMHPATNEFRQIVAHLVIARHGLLTMLDLNPEPLPWKGLGEATQAGFVKTDTFPPMQALVAEWNRLSAFLRERLPTTTAAALAKPSPMPIPGVENATLGHFLPINAIHEAYHIGQLGLMVKALSGRGVMTP